MISGQTIYKRKDRSFTHSAKGALHKLADKAIRRKKMEVLGLM